MIKGKTALALSLSTVLVGSGGALAGEDLLRALDQKICSGCKLQDADLVHADLRDAKLKQAQLQRANLSRAQLDGADLSGANLTDAAMVGASLRGADLRGAKLEGTDLRDADLSGAKFDPDALAASHWKGATGVSADASSYAAMHNAGVEAAQQGRFPEAETFFNKALVKKPDAAVTWLARGITRAEQANLASAQQDINYAATLFEQQGDSATANELKKGLKAIQKAEKAKNGNGYGSQILKAAGGLFQQLAPIAVKMFAPMAF